MNYDDLSQFVFDFMDEYLILEARGMRYYVDDEVFEERMAHCYKCENYDEQADGCKLCGCFMQVKGRDQFESCPDKKWFASSDDWNKKYYQSVLKSLRKRVNYENS